MADLGPSLISKSGPEEPAEKKPALGFEAAFFQDGEVVATYADGRLDLRPGVETDAVVAAVTRLLLAAAGPRIRAHMVGGRGGASTGGGGGTGDGFGDAFFGG